MGMFKMGDKVIEVLTGIQGEVKDLDAGEEYSIGIEWNDEQDSVWWYKESDVNNLIKKC